MKPLLKDEKLLSGIKVDEIVKVIGNLDSDCYSMKYTYDGKSILVSTSLNVCIYSAQNFKLIK